MRTRRELRKQGLAKISLIRMEPQAQDRGRRDVLQRLCDVVFYLLQISFTTKLNVEKNCGASPTRGNRKFPGEGGSLA